MLTVEFNPITYNVNEEDQLVTLTIVLSNPAAEDVSVSIETNDGSALGIQKTCISNDLRTYGL